MRDGGRDSPQRSPTQTLVPSGSMATALVEPQVRPCGNVPQFSIERYGFGSELVGALVCAKAEAADRQNCDEAHSQRVAQVR